MEEELRDLRLELKTARSDVKRYASFALRLQQELAREKQKTKDLCKSEDILDEEDARFSAFNAGPLGTSLWDKKVDNTREKHVKWSRKIDRVVQMLEEREKHDNQVDESLEDVMQEIGPFLQQQKRLIMELGRDNAKLRDMVHARPTRRELLTSQLDVDRLQRQVQKLRERVRGVDTDVKEPRAVHPVETSACKGSDEKTPSLSERIMGEKLLQSLRVRTKSSVTHHMYLKEKLHCFLTLDFAGLASKQQDLTETAVLEHVGRICSDIVASCCYVLEIDEVGDLPRRVEKAHQLSNVSATYQAFVERIEKLLKRFDKDAFYSIRAESTAETSCREALNKILSHVNDVLVELDARREQMKPPNSKAHQILLKNMKLLRVSRIDELAPTIRRLIDNMKAEQEFLQELRELLGLDEAATRKQILKVATILFGELGFLTGNARCTLNRGNHTID